MDLKKIISRVDIIKNIMLSIGGNFVFIFVSQLVVYPLLSNTLAMDEFGALLTLIAISNLLGTVFGGTLNNIRLIHSQEYKEQGCEGDFRILLEYGAVMSILCMLIGLFFFREQVQRQQWILLPLLAVLTMLRSYMGVAYRIALNYRQSMCHQISVCIGFLIGIPIFFLTREWTLIFLTGESVALLFALRTTRLLSEPRRKTVLFRKSFKDTVHLILANLTVHLTVHLDRLLINPVMGPANVAVYFASSLVGKTMSIVLQPVAGVSLSYLAKARKEQASFLYMISILGSLVSGIVAFALSFLLSPLIIRLLYPNVYEAALPLFLVANLAAILASMGLLLQPVLLRYCPLGWQMRIQVVFSAVYLTGGYYFMVNYGLWGFCIGSIIAQCVKLAMMVGVGYYYAVKKLPFPAMGDEGGCK